MAETAIEPGVVLFGVCIAFMVAFAGAASMAPASNHRLLEGAAALFILWLLILNFRVVFSIHPSFIVFLDIAYAVFFYFLSRSGKTASAHNYDWAGYICIIFIAIAIFEIVDVIFITEIQSRISIALFFVLFFGIVGWGFFRGFGLIAGLIFFAIAGVTVLLANQQFWATLNIMSLSAIFVIIFYSTPPLMQNLKAWFGGGDDNTLSSNNKSDSL